MSRRSRGKWSGETAAGNRWRSVREMGIGKYYI